MLRVAPRALCWLVPLPTRVPTPGLWVSQHLLLDFPMAFGII